ncbi:7-cyano-7-deazaguanine synthase [Candidatus Nitrosotenuis uzonensis]|uniref:7-cyano-7-deazaguanine synthase n=1 Tax=Candidatus Nitrosotenuis uzonensis TaxID=1407055 RepID=V6AUN4_9ARCH|nr:7-cyano-7-deazaguanine synthase [Candidatus Nitrosotenuis uzonensis]CDI06586.1 ExsB family protein [Candidatus Nitrosotenuis uzonensis]
MRKAVVVLSGGLDSLCLGAHLGSKYELYGITFSYGQRASQELNSARRVGRTLGLKDHRMVRIDFMKSLYGESNVLTNTKKKLPEKFEYSIVVPIRNAIFVTIASAWAFALNASIVAYGAHTDDTKYSDCRPSFSKKLQEALNQGESDGIALGIRSKIEIWTPYIAGLSKSDLIKAGYKKFGNEIFKTWSCYSNAKIHCGRCESCNNRKTAFEKAGIADRTRYLVPSF